MTVFTKAQTWFASLAKLMQSVPSYHMSLNIYFNIELLSLFGSFPSAFPIKFVCASQLSSVLHAPSFLIFPHSITLIMCFENYKL